MKKTLISGIYSITNTINGKVYYGSTNDIKNRFKNHRNELNKNRHKNLHLQYAWNKYGKQNFIFNIEEEIPVNNLQEIEQHYLDWCKTFPFWSYNISYNSIFPNRGITRSTETKLKMSISKKGKNHPNFGKPLSDETKKNLSNALKGRIFSNETKRKMSNSSKGEKNSMYGNHWSKEAKKHLSECNKGKVRSNEFKQKMKIAQSGEKHSQYDDTIYIFSHPIYGIEKNTQYKLRKKYKINQGNLGQLVKGKYNVVCGWRILKYE